MKHLIEFDKFINEKVNFKSKKYLEYKQKLQDKMKKDNEEADIFFKTTLKDSYWKDIAKLYPNYKHTIYQNPKKDDFSRAQDYILDKMMEKYPNENWNKIKRRIKFKIFDKI